MTDNNPYSMDSGIVATGWPGRYTPPIYSYDRPSNRVGIYFLFGGADYEGEEHIGIFHTLKAAMDKFDELREDPEFYTDDWATIYTIGMGRLKPFVRWSEEKVNGEFVYAWRRVKE